MGQPVAFFEVTSPNPERAQKFYAELFGWQVNADPAMGGYALVNTAPATVPSAAASEHRPSRGTPGSRSTCASTTWRPT